ncbi:MAG TPA: polysaccharide biosynthesis/export family protein [Verrucomicrobiae bacterium]
MSIAIDMNVSRYLGKLAPYCGLLAMAWLMTGCEHLYYADPNPTKPYVFPGQENVAIANAGSTTTTPPQFAPVGTQSGFVPQPGYPATQPQAAVNAAGTAGRIILQKGDPVTVTFSDLPPNMMMPDSKQRIADDGTITLPYNVKVIAEGKTASQLQGDIQKEYVPRYFVRLTVNVRTEERYYYVGGEVKRPDRYQYMGDLTVLRAIDTAAGFTDFAQRKNIELRRAGTGQKYKINYNDAIKDPNKDMPVYPNDQVIVHKRSF